MDYKDKIKQIHHEDPILEEEELKALYAIEAADKVLEILNWVLCSGDRRANITARAATLGYVLGQYGGREAAKLGGTDEQTIRRMKDKFCKNFGVEKKGQNGVIKRSG